MFLGRISLDTRPSAPGHAFAYDEPKGSCQGLYFPRRCDDPGALLSNFVRVEVRHATAEMLRAEINEPSVINSDVLAAFSVE